MTSNKSINALYIYDLDHTLFYYDGDAAMATVVDQNGTEIYRLQTHEEYRTYVLPEGCRYDHNEFISAEIFAKTAKPISPLVELIQLDNIIPGRTVILTARAEFDNKELVKETLLKHGITAEIYNSGSIPDITSQAHGKQVMIRRFIDEWNPNWIHLHDDSESNLKAFLELEFEYPNIRFHANHVKMDNETKIATIQRYRLDD